MRRHSNVELPDAETGDIIGFHLLSETPAPPRGDVTIYAYRNIIVTCNQGMACYSESLDAGEESALDEASCRYFEPTP